VLHVVDGTAARGEHDLEVRRTCEVTATALGAAAWAGAAQRQQRRRRPHDGEEQRVGDGERRGRKRAGPRCKRIRQHGRAREARKTAVGRHSASSRAVPWRAHADGRTGTSWRRARSASAATWACRTLHARRNWPVGRAESVQCWAVLLFTWAWPCLIFFD
jgi:hypothetical protein